MSTPSAPQIGAKNTKRARFAAPGPLSTRSHRISAAPDQPSACVEGVCGRCRSLSARHGRRPSAQPGEEGLSERVLDQPGQ
jgi:hypothetical protein